VNGSSQLLASRRQQGNQRGTVTAAIADEDGVAVVAAQQNSSIQQEITGNFLTSVRCFAAKKRVNIQVCPTRHEIDSRAREGRRKMACRPDATTVVTETSWARHMVAAAQIAPKGNWTSPGNDPDPT
jgi:hypothetical protein